MLELVALSGVEMGYKESMRFASEKSLSASNDSHELAAAERKLDQSSQI